MPSSASSRTFGARRPSSGSAALHREGVAVLLDPHSQHVALLTLRWPASGIRFEDQEPAAALRGQHLDHARLVAGCDDGVADHRSHSSAVVTSMGREKAATSPNDDFGSASRARTYADASVRVLRGPTRHSAGGHFVDPARQGDTCRRHVLERSRRWLAGRLVGLTNQLERVQRVQELIIDGSPLRIRGPSPATISADW